MQSSLASSCRIGLTAHAGSRPGSRPVLSRPVPRGARQQSGARTVVRSTTEGQDIDSILSQLADKFEKSENKGAIIGYGAAGVIAFFFSEWLIHLPLLNFLLGFPIQLVGLLSLPYLGVRYLAEGKDYKDDLKLAAGSVTKRLPGLEK